MLASLRAHFASGGLCLKCSDKSGEFEDEDEDEWKILA